MQCVETKTDNFLLQRLILFYKKNTKIDSLTLILTKINFYVFFILKKKTSETQSRYTTKAYHNLNARQ